MIRFQPTSLEPFFNDYQSIVSSALFCWKGELCSIYRSPFVVLKTLNVSYTINIYDMMFNLFLSIPYTVYAILEKSLSRRGTKKLTFQKQSKRESYVSTVEGRHNKGRPIGVLLQTSQNQERLSTVNQTYSSNASSMLTLACSYIVRNIIQVLGFLTFHMLASLIKSRLQ